MKKEPLQLTQDFIAIPSTADKPAALDEILQLALTQLELGCTVEHFEKNGSRSILAYNREHRPEVFPLILNGHLDVNPGKESQFQPRIIGDRLYGVGSMDMKASISCLLAVFNEVAPTLEYPLALQLVTDEQMGGFNGTKHQIEEGVKADFVIAAEPTNFNIVNKAKGILRLKIVAPGQTAHSAYPWRGKNAVWSMNGFLNRLRQEFPEISEPAWISTINVASMETPNSSFSKIPDECMVSIDTRFVPEEANSIKDRIVSLVPNDFRLEILVDEPALNVEETNPQVMLLKKTASEVTGSQVMLYGAQGSSDARHYTRVGTNGVEFGPKGDNIGADDEWVSITSIQTYIAILTAYTQRYLGA